MEGRLFSERDLGERRRRVVRLGARLRAGDLPTMPRVRAGVSGTLGVVVGAWLRPRTGEIWLRLRAARPLARRVRTVPLTATQPPTAAAGALDLRHDMRVDCDGGYIGRLEGMVVETRTGLASGLLIHVRGNVAGDVAGPTDPLAPLVAVAGQRMIVPSVWATQTIKVSSPVPLLGDRLRVRLSASPAQIAHSLTLRRDAALAAEIQTILAANPAIQPSLPHLRVVVRDGTVTLLGSVPSARHRLSAEQDVWHIPGVLAVHNELIARG
jgi:hypothetical protein